MSGGGSSLTAARLVVALLSSCALRCALALGLCRGVGREPQSDPKTSAGRSGVVILRRVFSKPDLIVRRPNRPELRVNARTANRAAAPHSGEVLVTAVSLRAAYPAFVSKPPRSVLIRQIKPIDSGVTCVTRLKLNPLDVHKVAALYRAAALSACSPLRGSKLLVFPVTRRHAPNESDDASAPPHAQSMSWSRLPRMTGCAERLQVLPGIVSAIGLADPMVDHNVGAGAATIAVFAFPVHGYTLGHTDHSMLSAPRHSTCVSSAVAADGSGA